MMDRSDTTVWGVIHSAHMVIYNMHGTGYGRQGRVTFITFVTSVTQHFGIIQHSHNLAFFVVGQCRRCRDLEWKHDVTGSCNADLLKDLTYHIRKGLAWRRGEDGQICQ
jgi:hypothetical protein